MIGVSLSRWTTAYFAVALVALAAAELMMIAGYGFPTVSVAAAPTLVLVHLVAIGWLSLLMCGALLQFLPVLVAQPLHSNFLGLPALVALVAGLAVLVLGFLQLEGLFSATISFFTIAATLLIIGFVLILWNLIRTVLAAKTIPLPAWFVIIGLISIVFTVALGATFALVLGGISAYPPMIALTTNGLPIHIIAGLGGWLTVTAIGVSYRLLAMFMLAPEVDRATTRGALYLGAAALGIAVVGGIAAVLIGGSLTLVLVAAFAVGLCAIALYGADVLHLYRARRRPKIELNSRMAAYALASLAATVVLTTLLLAVGRLGEHAGAVIFLAAFGWLSGLGLSQLYKIVAFMTWLECYGPVLGKAPTPRVQDLVVEGRAHKWFVLYFLSVWAGTALLLIGLPLTFRVVMAGLFVATIGIIAQLVRTRRLADVEEAARFPKGVHRPRLLLSPQP